MIRQGDVLLIPVAVLPSDAVPEPREGGRVILAHGEVTGHAHEVEEVDMADIVVSAGTRYLVPQSRVSLIHQEHGTLTVERPVEIRRQREYAPGAIRNVMD